MDFLNWMFSCINNQLLLLNGNLICSKVGASNSPSYENLSSKSLRLIFLPEAGGLQWNTHKQQVKVPMPIIATTAKTAKRAANCSL